jgi:acyl carrier protein
MAGGGAGARGARPVLPTAYEAPRDELEEQLAAIWQELFGIEPIGRDDSFLELGGHSLLAIQIVTQVRQSLDADLPVTAVFEAPTVAQLAAAVRQARGESDPAALEELLALVEGLSPDQAAARLAEMAEAEA